jgi:hypothetical protein
MNDLTASIRALDDATASRLLATVAKHRLQPSGDTITSLTPELTQALAAVAGDISGAAAPATPGELARATLLLLAEDAGRQAEIRALIDHPSTPSYGADPVTFTVLSVAALIAIQSYVEVEYDQKKGLHVKLVKQPLDKSLLGKIIGLLQRLAVGS